MVTQTTNITTQVIHTIPLDEVVLLVVSVLTFLLVASGVMRLAYQRRHPDSRRARPGVG